MSKRDLTDKQLAATADRCAGCKAKGNPVICEAAKKQGGCQARGVATADALMQIFGIPKVRGESPRPAAKFVCFAELSGMRLVNPLNNRQHWRTVWARSQKQRAAACVAIWDCVGVAYRALQIMRIVTITRVGPAELDDDNLAASAKPVRDGIADAFGINDKSPLWKWQYAQRKCKRGNWSVEITIEQVEA